MGLFSLIFTLGVDRKPLEKGLKEAKNNVSSFGDEVKGTLAKAFAIGAIGAYAKTLVDAAGKLADLSARAGISTTALQEIDFAAKQSGSSMEDFVDVLQKVAKARKAALDDNTGAEAKSFARFGVFADSLKSARLEDIVGMIADEMQRMGDSQLYIADALEIMGKGAGSVIPTMASDFNRLRDAAKESGVIVSELATQNLDQWGDKFDVFGMKVKKVASEIAGYFADLHNRAGIFVDALGATVAAPFVEDGYMKAKMAWNTDRVATDRFHSQAMPELVPMVFRQGDFGGLTGGQPNQFGEWQGPLLPAGWRPPEDAKAQSPSFRQVSRKSDSLVAVGNFLGANPNAGIVHEFREIKQKISAIEKHTKKVADGAITIRK